MIEFVFEATRFISDFDNTRQKKSKMSLIHSELLPRAASEDERIFFSCYRLSALRRGLLKTVPVLGSVIMILFPLFSWVLYRSITQEAAPDTPQEILNTIELLCFALAACGFSMGILLLLVSRMLIKRILQTQVICTSEAIVQCSPDKDIRILWNTVTKIREFKLGRVQKAIIHDGRQKISIDPTLIEMQHPLPRLKFTWRAEVLEYPDGTLRPLDLKNSELYNLVKKLCASPSQRQS